LFNSKLNGRKLGFNTHLKANYVIVLDDIGECDANEQIPRFHDPFWLSHNLVFGLLMF